MLKIKYNNNIKVEKQLLNTGVTAERPKICVIPEDNSYYSLIMYDADAVEPDFLHLLIININKKIKPNELIDYAPPNPPTGTGIHKYVFVLCTQPNVLKVGKIKKRNSFNTKEFITKHKLNIVDYNYFTVAS